MKTLTTLFLALILLVTIGLRTLDTNFALNEAHSTATVLVAGVDGDGAPGSDNYNSWAG